MGDRDRCRATGPLRCAKLLEKSHQIASFREKDSRDGGFVSGGFFVCEPQIFDLIDDDATVWEQAPMRRLVEARQLRAYRHQGFWQSMDTLRDKQVSRTFGLLEKHRGRFGRMKPIEDRFSIKLLKIPERACR